MTIPVVPALYAIQYDGTNGAAVVSALNGNLITDTGTQLDWLGADTFPYTLLLGEWAIWTFTPALNPLGIPVYDATFAVQYRNLQALVTSLAPTGAGASLVQSSGSAAVPASVLGQTANYDVTMSPALPDTSYKPVAQLRGAPGIISGHGILSVTVLSTTQVRVSIQSAAASLAGGSVVVTAFALA